MGAVRYGLSLRFVVGSLVHPLDDADRLQQVPGDFLDGFHGLLPVRVTRGRLGVFLAGSVGRQINRFLLLSCGVHVLRLTLEHDGSG